MIATARPPRCKPGEISAKDLFEWVRKNTSNGGWQEVTTRGIMPHMLTRTERTIRRSMLQFRWVVIAVLAVLLSGVAFGASSEADVYYDGEEEQFLQLINEYRQSNGVGPLTLSDTLSVASERHSEDMGEYNFFAHDTVKSSYYPAYSEPWDRMKAEGYDYNTFKGENIAAGYETAEKVLQGWRNSPSHNHAMLDGNYHAIGIARVHVPGSKFGWYWTTDFGGVVEPASSTPDVPEDDPQALGAPEKLAEPTEVRPAVPVRDLGELENGTMQGQGAWKQKAKDGAKLILDDGYARLGGYHRGRDDFYQKIRISKDSEMLGYDIKITTDERERPFDRLVVRLTNKDGKQLAVLTKYTGEDAGRWRREKLDLSRFVGRTVYLSFYVETDPTQLTTFYLDNLLLREPAEPPTSE
jgi:uncharacterized protein YkwD